MERGMQFPPYLYELFKRVKSIVVPEFLLYDFFFMSNLVLFQVRLQTQPLPAAGEKPMYSGAMDCVKKTIAKEGPRGLYKGKNS